MLLLNRRLAAPEQQRVGVILGERGATLANFLTVDALGVRLKTAALRGRWRFARPVIVDRVWLVVGGVGINIHPVHAVTLEVVIRAGGFVNRDFMEVRPAQTANLRIGIREKAALQ